MNQTPPRVLIVEDNPPDDARAFSETKEFSGDVRLLGIEIGGFHK